MTAQTPLTVPGPGVLANDADPESQPLAAQLASGPAHGSLTLASDGGFAFIPGAGFAGPDSFSYRASDGAQLSAPATVTIGVTPTACVPRPLVQANPAPGGGRLLVHVGSTPLNTQQPNPLSQIRFGAFLSAKVTLNGQPVASGQSINVPASASAVDITVERVTPGQPTTVPFTVVDGCGEWPPFVGGGASAGF